MVYKLDFGISPPRTVSMLIKSLEAHIVTTITVITHKHEGEYHWPAVSGKSFHANKNEGHALAA